MSLTSIVKKALPLAQRNVFFNQVRNESAMSSPPTYRMPFTEKVIMGSFMIAAILAVPTWVMVNLSNYNKKEGEEE